MLLIPMERKAQVSHKGIAADDAATFAEKSRGDGLLKRGGFVG